MFCRKKKLSEEEAKELGREWARQKSDVPIGQSGYPENYYQRECANTAVYPPEIGVLYLTLGLACEAGEVAEKVKKLYRDHGGKLDAKKKNEIAFEISDVYWYCAMLLHELGYTVVQCQDMNLQKLKDRQKRGKLHGSGDER